VDDIGTTTSGVSASAERAINFPDAAFGAILIVLLLPLLMLIALAVYLEDGGPIFFRQRRIAQQGRLFVLYKFRKFRAGLPDGGRVLTLRDDDRFTRVGRLLERMKLDELPQLWNVVKGDMSIVGPRPESLAFADCFRGRYRELLMYRPGIVGPAQALFRNESALYPIGQDSEQFYREVLFPAKANIDLSYYPARSWITDCTWTVRCFLAVLAVTTNVYGSTCPEAAVTLTALQPSLQKNRVG